MSKKRKTKKQKIQASTRHDYANVLTFANQQIQLAPVDITSSIKPTASYATVTDYSYVAADVRKTIFITIALLALNIAIYFILKLAIITIPGIVF